MKNLSLLFHIIKIIFFKVFYPILCNQNIYFFFFNLTTLTPTFYLFYFFLRFTFGSHLEEFYFGFLNKIYVSDFFHTNLDLQGTGDLELQNFFANLVCKFLKKILKNRIHQYINFKSTFFFNLFFNAKNDEKNSILRICKLTHFNSELPPLPRMVLKITNFID